MRGRNRMPEWKIEYAKRQRRQPTPTEALLWEHLRMKQLDGAHFRQQAPLYGYIADFYCAKRNLVVEVDGPYHDERKAQDATRDEHLRHYGITTLRFTNDRVHEDLATVLAEIAEFSSLEAAA